MTPSTRAQVVARRTYSRPLDSEGSSFETWHETCVRAVQHQRWLWERAKGGAPLNSTENEELAHLFHLIWNRQAMLAGRTLWLGGTDVAKTREASQFNCSFAKVETIYDVVDAYWLLLQGCGVGFEPVVGTLSGFTSPLEIEIRRSQNSDQKGPPDNIERIQRVDGKTLWFIYVGDSAEAWAKAVGKILANKRPVDRLIIDFRDIRAPGQRLSGYGWISSGDTQIHSAFRAIAELLNRRAGQLLTRIDILDVMNHLGMTLSSRRSAEIALVPYSDPEWEAFATAKADYWTTGNPQRSQSNNSLVFHQQPSRAELREIFGMMIDAGGSEPGFINAETALRRAPWFKGTNPCAEILLGNKSFCNLVDINVAAFNGNYLRLLQAVRIMARANYRQTCVDFRDGVLQSGWHELNQFLRLTGVGLTGIARWDRRDNPEDFRTLRRVAQNSVNDMSDELGLPRSKAVTTIKPSGTVSKVMDTTEGIHRPLGRYLLNNVNFSEHDPAIPALEAAGYRVFENPYDSTGRIVSFPVAWEDVEFTDIGGGKFVNRESAIEQLEAYKLVMDHYVDHNCSVTISYDPSEAHDIVDWVRANWDSYVGVSFLLRNDPSRTAEDLGFPYLPQEVITKEEHDAYASTLSTVDLDAVSALDAIDVEDCEGGVCPIR